MFRRSTTHSGITMIEVLVVLSIIAGILSLMLPAVQKAREAARRSQCINNLRQLSLALHNYENTYQVLPPGVVDTRRPVGNRLDGLQIGWIVQLLPYMEQSYVHEAIDTRLSVYGPENSTASLTRLNTLTCPSDPWPTPIGGRQASSYAACHHDVEAPIDVDNHGAFFLNSRVSHEGLTDGSSFTIFVGEKLSQPWDNGGWMSGTRSTLRNTGSPINAPPRDAGGAVGGFSSLHLDGANFAFGDGSVRFLVDRIDPVVYRRLGHRADGEPIDDDAL